MRGVRDERGFTLIELGIVIAVIAVLATVVIVGKGFVQTSKVSKIIDAVDVIRKASGTLSGLGGGQFPGNSTGSEMQGLRIRGFVPGTGAGAWEPMRGFTIEEVQWSSGLGAANRVGIKIYCQQGQCLDIWNSYNQDPNRQTAGNAGTLTCSAGANLTTTELVLCFMI